jgi:starch-binding outer membrane protein, SusD/RagB family
MKKILYSFLLIAAVLLIPQSCSEDYLETNPTSSLSTETVFTTTQNAWAALNGIHRMMFMQWGNMDQAGQSGMMLNIEFLGEDLVSHARGNGWFIAMYQWNTSRNENSAQSWFPWRVYYRIIANANMIIENIDNATGPQADKDVIKGQALAYRGWAHFNLVQLYGKRYDWNNIPNNQDGVPLMTFNSIEPQPRATVEDVYTQIKLDLDDAITLLDGKAVPAKSHLSWRVARGIRARVALATGDWATAASQAAQARAGASLMSAAQLLEGFTFISNPEFIWGSEQVTDEPTYFHSFFAFISFNFSSTNIRTNPKKINNVLYETMSATDLRRQLWEPDALVARDRVRAAGMPNSAIGTTHHSFKFQARGPGDSRGDVPYMRTAELILIEAEANARLGLAGDAAATTAAQNALFVLMSNRDPGYVLSTNTGQALLNEIMTHRRIELWGEGHRFYDLKRQNLALNRNGANHDATLAIVMDVPAGDPAWQWKIPIDEINANPLMTQNP